jgi:hypothetical protein
VNKARLVPGAAGASFVYRLYSTGARTEPWGTPAYIFLAEKFAVYQDFKFSVSEKRRWGLSKILILTIYTYSRSECYVMSKAFSISKNTAAVDISLLKFRVTWSASVIHWSVELWFARKPNWLAFSKFLSSVCFWVFLKISFSNSLPVVDKRLIGRKFGGDFGSLLAFISRGH